MRNEVVLLSTRTERDLGKLAGVVVVVNGKKKKGESEKGACRRELKEE
jgi:8-oxo-dGTP pyrophosphatase MutT (NUDIX family)